MLINRIESDMMISVNTLKNLKLNNTISSFHIYIDLNDQFIDDHVYFKCCIINTITIQHFKGIDIKAAPILITDNSSINFLTLYFGSLHLFDLNSNQKRLKSSSTKEILLRYNNQTYKNLNCNYTLLYETNTA